MNALYFNQRLSARILAAVALFSLVAGMLPAQAFASAPVNTYTVSSSPASINFNGTQTMTFTVTNSPVSAGPLKAFYIVLPAGFTVGTPSISSAAWGTLYNSSLNRIEASDSAGNAGNGLLPGQSVTVTVSATHTGSSAGTFGWNICSFKNNSFAPGGGAQFTPTSCLPASLTVNPAVVDVCPNIPDAQATIPAGKMIDNAGNCVDIPTPPVDLCLNLAGVQTSVPTGYVANGTNCDPVTPPTDFCPNIADVQDAVPSGMMLDGSGNCVAIPVDVCLNLDGLQTSVPTGYVANGTNCDPVTPPLDLCPNIDGAQTTLPAGKMIDNTGNCVDVPVPVACTVIIVSDASDFVLEKGTNAQILSVIHPAWTATLGSASWIWGDNPVATPGVSETQTFQKKFGFIGSVTSATLEVASDNDHNAVVNANIAHVGGSTFGSPATYDVTSEITSGNNELDIAVTNTGVVDSNPSSNPAGLKYKLTINGTVTTDSDCATPYVPPVVDVCPNIEGPQATIPTGYHYDDEDDCIADVVPVCASGSNLLVNGSFEDDHGLSDGSYGIFTSILGWTYSLSDGVEVWRNFLTMPSDADQLVELDGNDATKITQTVTTIPGATYELRFDFAARSADAADNHIDAAVDGTSLMNVSTDNTAWTTYSKTFVADGSSDVSFEDQGTPQDPGGTGTLLDNAVLCYVSGPETTNDGGGNGGGGGGGGHRHHRTPNGEVLGEATSTLPEVLGDQVTAVPAGAPNAGAGSTSPFALSFYNVAPVAFIRRTRVHG